MPTLTVASVEALKPGAVRREIADDLRRGLYLIIQPSGAKSWAVRYRFAGKTCKHTLGQFPKIGVAAARELCRDALEKVGAGVNPATVAAEASKAADEAKAAQIARAQAEVDSTVQAAWDDYVAEYLPGLRIGTRDNYKRSFTHILPKWKTLQVEVFHFAL